MMMGELFASDVKGVASAIAVMLNWTLVFIITKTFGMMQASWGSGKLLNIEKKSFNLFFVNLRSNILFLRWFYGPWNNICFY